VISSEEEEVLGILDFVTEQKENGLKTLLPSVDVIPEEEIVGGGWEAAHLKETNKIRVLTVHVTNNLDGWRKLDERGLTQEYFSGGLADSDNLGILQAQRFADLAGVTNIQQTLYHVVDVQLPDFVLARARS
jgi:hypothetical protein